MARPKGALNTGMRFLVRRRARELLMTSKDLKGSVEKLSAAASSYQKLLNRAMKSASPDDAAALQRLGTGLLALTKVLSAVEKLREEKQHSGPGEPVDFTVLGDPIYSKQ